LSACVCVCLCRCLQTCLPQSVRRSSRPPAQPRSCLGRTRATRSWCRCRRDTQIIAMHICVYIATHECMHTCKGMQSVPLTQQNEGDGLSQCIEALRMLIVPYSFHTRLPVRAGQCHRAHGDVSAGSLWHPEEVHQREALSKCGPTIGEHSAPLVAYTDLQICGVFML
jgi:hypothetical protein